MFSIETILESGWLANRLVDHQNQTAVTIIPACGAILQSFEIGAGNIKLNIIESYSNADDFYSMVESKGFRGCKLSPFVCRLKNGCYTWNGIQHQTEGFYLGKHALHGLLYKSSFDIEESGCDAQGAFIRLVHHYRKNDPGYPFDFDCEVIYKLTSGNNLEIKTTITNHSSQAIPICDGWHPYFSFNESINDLELWINADKQVEMDEELIPTGNLITNHLFTGSQKIGDTALDHCFVLSDHNKPACVLSSSSQNIVLEITACKAYPYLQLYTPDSRKSLAIENLSAAPDAFNNKLGLIELGVGEKWEGVIGWRVGAS